MRDDVNTMTNVVEQAMHPMLEEAIEAERAAHQIEIAQVRSDMQDKVDELQDRVDNAQGSFDEQYLAFDRLLREDKEGKPIPISFNQLVEATNLKLSSYHNDWDVLYPLRRVLERVTEQVRVVERTETVYEFPPGLRSLVKGFVDKLDEYV